MYARADNAFGLPSAFVQAFIVGGLYLIITGSIVTLAMVAPRMEDDVRRRAVSYVSLVMLVLGVNSYIGLTKMKGVYRVPRLVI